MPSLDSFLASGATALTLSLLFLYLFITGRIVPGKMLDRALKGWEDQRQATDRLTAVVDTLAKQGRGH